MSGGAWLTPRREEQEKVVKGARVKFFGHLSQTSPCSGSASTIPASSSRLCMSWTSATQTRRSHPRFHALYTWDFAGRNAERIFLVCRYPSDALFYPTATRRPCRSLVYGLKPPPSHPNSTSRQVTTPPFLSGRPV